MSQTAPVGHPPKWAEVEPLQKAINGYFSQWDGLEAEDPQAKKAPNLFGLCLFADMSYDCFIDYESGSMDKDGKEFSVPCLKARLKCLNYAGEKVYTHTAGSVFTHVNLTRKFKEPWKNAQSNEVTGANGGDLKIIITPSQASII